MGIEATIQIMKWLNSDHSLIQGHRSHIPNVEQNARGERKITYLGIEATFLSFNCQYLHNLAYGGHIPI